MKVSGRFTLWPQGKEPSIPIGYEAGWVLKLVLAKREGFTSNSVAIETGYRLDGRVSIPGKGKRFFSSSQLPDLGPTQPPIQWVKGKAVPVLN
jgi:hypothetical protein